MRVPALTWKRRANVAALTVSFGRVWETREATDDLLLGYNAVGRLARVTVLDAARLLPADGNLAGALTAVLQALQGCGQARADDLDVLRSAFERAGLSRSA